MTWHRREVTYCSNVHPGESLEALRTRTVPAVAAVREFRGLSRMAAGLWMSAAAADALDRDRVCRRRFEDLLQETGIDLLTVNGFPFGDFHADVVKERVYRPDWADPRRLNYTLSLARTLAAQLPPGEDYGSISTLPLGWQPYWTAERHEAALHNLCRCAAELVRLRERTGRCVRIALEPEPGCVMESSKQAIDLFAQALPAASRATGVSQEAIEAHLGLCFDVCHQAIMFEDPADVLPDLLDAGVPVIKIQLSNALELGNVADEAGCAALREYMEPRYLHQVRARASGGALAGAHDLPQAMAGGILADGPWRIHFHVPLNAATVADGCLTTTRHAVERTLDVLAVRPGWKPHLEIETYTWGVLPDGVNEGGDLTDAIGRELEWLEHRLAARGLLAV